MKKKIKKPVKKTALKKGKKKPTVKKKPAPKKKTVRKVVKKPIKANKKGKVKAKAVKATAQVVRPAPVASAIKQRPVIANRFTSGDINMSPSELGQFKQLLEKQLEELQSDFGKKYQNMNTSALPDINDQASAESERNFEIRIKDRERKLIGKVQEALKKVAEGTYGICESCGEAIGTKRLMARPVTNLCINCKAEMEADEKREESLLISLQQSKSSSL